MITILPRHHVATSCVCSSAPHAHTSPPSVLCVCVLRVVLATRYLLVTIHSSKQTKQASKQLKQGLLVSECLHTCLSGQWVHVAGVSVRCLSIARTAAFHSNMTSSGRAILDEGETRGAPLRSADNARAAQDDDHHTQGKQA